MGSHGIQRERQVRQDLEADAWWVTRAAGSLGDADLVALKHGHTPRLIEVKATAGGPYERFGPRERERLRRAARTAGATAELAYWPPRGRLRYIAETEWPGEAKAA